VSGAALVHSNELCDRESLQTALELIRGTEGQVAHLTERLNTGPAGRALGHDGDPDRLDTSVSALGDTMGSPRLCGPCGLERVEGVGLAPLTPSLAVLAIHFDHVDPRSGEEAGDASPIGTRALHADLRDVAKGLEPGEQLCVSARVGLERPGPEQASDLVEGGGHVDLSVGVDASGDGARSFYDGHVIPFFP
jgi:hypothetical protein